ncbi:hypothetical protein D3C84_831430 [compost metagenome]
MESRVSFFTPRVMSRRFNGRDELLRVSGGVQLMSHYLGVKKKFNAINRQFLCVFKPEKGSGEYSSGLVVNARLGGCSAPFMAVAGDRFPLK